MREISTFSSSKDEKQQDGELSMGGKVSWVDVYLPRQVRPYAHLARIDKKIGTWLLAWPTMW
jgi:4-hydroxybenzoate polyprenyltransferase